MSEDAALGVARQRVEDCQLTLTLLLDTIVVMMLVGSGHSITPAISSRSGHQVYFTPSNVTHRAASIPVSAQHAFQTPFLFPGHYEDDRTTCLARCCMHCSRETLEISTPQTLHQCTVATAVNNSEPNQWTYRKDFNQELYHMQLKTNSRIYCEHVDHVDMSVRTAAPCQVPARHVCAGLL